MLDYFETTSSDINMASRLDFIYWNPTKQMSDSIEYTTLVECVGEDSLKASAFYPAITFYYQSKAEDNGELIPFIRVTDTRKNLIDFSSTVFLNKELVANLSKSIKTVHPKDIVITKGGEYIGETTLVPDDYNEYAICRDVLAISTRHSKLSGEYLASFFQSKYGKSELKRTRSVQGQPHLTLAKLYGIKIPIFNNDFKELIQRDWDTFFELVKESDAHLIRAKKKLSDILAIREVTKQAYTFSKVLTTREITQRCDFEFYQKRWTSLIATLQEEGVSFHNICYIKDELDVSENAVCQYITLADIDERSGTIKEYRPIKFNMLPDRAKRSVQVGDVLVSSLRGSRDKVAIVDEDRENLVASTGFYVVRDEMLSPEVLYLLFRSPYYTMFIEQMSSGAIMTSITEKYFKQLLIPNIPEQIQNEISMEVRGYLDKRQEAYDSLDDAIKMFDDKLC